MRDAEQLRRLRDAPGARVQCESRRAFNRAHAPVSNVAEKASSAAELVEELKASVGAFLAGKH